MATILGKYMAALSSSTVKKVSVAKSEETTTHLSLDPIKNVFVDRSFIIVFCALLLWHDPLLEEAMEQQSLKLF